MDRLQEVAEQYQETADSYRVDHLNRYPDSIDAVLADEKQRAVSSGLLLLGLLGVVLFFSSRRK